MIVVIIDYGMGNLRSIQKKLIQIGVNVEISNDVNIIAKADKLILPGVGHFANGIKNLKQYGLWDTLNNKVIIEKTPILGICLGMQLMANHSEEGDIQGLGWIDSKVVKFKMNDKLRYKVPHIGWNSTYIEKKSPLFDGISNDSMFYFVHSFHINCHNKEDILTTSNYEYSFSSAIQRDNIYGTQFHPEKSHDLGEQLLKNFLNI